jgi:casein kinase II subunit alpha
MLRAASRAARSVSGASLALPTRATSLGGSIAAAVGPVSAPARTAFVRPSTKNASESRVYADANTEANHAMWDYENFEPMWSPMDEYSVTGKVGRGKYSEVFAGVHEASQDAVVIKVLKPVKKLKIQREIKVLERIRGGAGVTQLRDAVRDPVSKTVCLVLDYAEGTDYKTLYPTLQDGDARYYLYQLLRALDFAHQNGVMHRDVKPHNVVIDPKTRRVKLIDWGLAEFYSAGHEYNIGVASRYFKGPELLVNMKDYDYSLDIWSYGCVMAEMVFLVHPLFQGKDNADQLVKLVKSAGSEAYRAYIAKYQAAVDPVAAQAVAELGDVAPRKWSKYVNDGNRHLAGPEALDLLSKLLVLDHQQRLTAAQALKHPYFDGVREQAEKDAAAEEAANTARALAAFEVRTKRAAEAAEAAAEAVAAQQEAMISEARLRVERTKKRAAAAEAAEADA